MEEGVYRRLSVYLDNLPGGFPPTESGVELRILKRLFTPDEAKLAIHITPFAEGPRVVARRAGISRDEAARRLEEMAKRGLILSRGHGGKGPPKYQAVQYQFGIWEFHVNDLDKDLIKDMEEYAPVLLRQAFKVPQMRTIPIGRSLTPEHKVLPYEMAEELVGVQKKFAVAPCICRRENATLGKGCGKREETCLWFGMVAEFGIKNGLAREIDLQEVLDILRWADEEGLVLQPANAKDALFICLCCGDCCEILKTYKRNPKPASMVISPFFASYDAENCQLCGICVNRCQMEALKIENDKFRLNLDRCIGCGLCVSTCPADSLRLVRKPESKQTDVPRNIIDSSIRLGKARGKITTPALVKMLVKSGIDRMLTIRRA